MYVSIGAGRCQKAQPDPILRLVAPRNESHLTARGAPGQVPHLAEAVRYSHHHAGRVLATLTEQKC